MTNAVAISFAGVGILEWVALNIGRVNWTRTDRYSSFLHNTSIAYFPRQPPSFAVKAATVIGFPLLAWFSRGFNFSASRPFFDVSSSFLMLHPPVA